MSVDGALYPRSELHERFGQQEVLDSGVPTAFTSEDKRNSALGVQAVIALDATITTLCAQLYEHNDRGGQTFDVTTGGDLGSARRWWMNGAPALWRPGKVCAEETRCDPRSSRTPSEREPTVRSV